MKKTLAILSVVICLNTNAQVCFNPAVNYATGSLPCSVISADFNNDGIEDLATANPGSDNVSVLIGTGSGNFGAPAYYVTGVDPMSVGSGDFNGDGKADLAVCNWTSNTVSVLLGSGTGTLGTPTDYAVGSESCSVISDDFNRDGKADLAVSNRGSNSVSILLGTGTGTFGVATNFPTGSQPRNVNKADFNGDGIVDLVTANFGSNTVSVILGTGTGSFESAAGYTAGSSPHSVTCGDFNRDGKIDLAVANIYSNNISVLIGTGTGTFGASVNYAVGVNPESITTSDINGDGVIDLAVANTNSHNVSVLLGTGAGSFGVATNIAVGTQPSLIISLDLNKDGKDDLVTENYGSNNVSVLINCTAICTGSFGPANNFVAGTNPRFIANGDLNRDGKTDLVVANQNSNSVSVLLGTGTGVFGSATNYPVGNLPISVSVSDLNQDGIADLAIANFNSDNISIMLGTGTGSFSAASNIPAGNGPTYIISLDLNKDGIDDLVVTNYYSNTVSVLLGTGTGSFGAATDFVTDSGPYSVTSADFNSDGNTDLATTNNLSGNVSVLLGTGTGSFGTAVNFPAGNNPNSITSADFNCDGISDLAIANRSSGNVSVLLGSGTGSFGTVTNYIVGSTPWSVISADFNRDGNVDLAATNQGSNNVSVLLGTGTGIFGVADNIPSNSGPISLTSADFNMDGKPDLALALNSSNNVSVLLNLILPNLNAGSDLIVCAGTPVTLSGSGATTYAWNNGVIDGTPFSPATTTTYTVTGTDVAGCTKTDSVVVTVNDLPLDLSITNSLLAYYPFNNNAYDESGNGLDATMTGSTVYSTNRFGVNNTAYLNDVGRSFTVPINNTMLGSNYTISFWSNLDNKPLYSFCVYYNNDNDNNYKVQLANDGVNRLYLRDVGDVGGYTVMALPNNNINQWEHITLVNANGVWKYYVNGNYVSEINKTISNLVFSKIFWCSHNPISSSFDLKGKVDDIRIYNRVLNDAEIKFLFKEGEPIGVNLIENIICQNTSTNIKLINSQNGISYQLLKDGTDSGSPLTGTGDTLTFNTGNLSSTSLFTIKATNNSTTCNIILDTVLTITVNPVYSFSENHSICDGETYNWQGTDYTSANTYTANYTSIYGCDSIYTLQLNVNPLPVPTITGPSSVCQNTAGNIYSTEPLMSGYTWTISAGGVITAGVGTNMITVTWNTAGAQSVSVNYTNGDGCAATIATVANVTVNTRPVPTIAGSSSVCQNTSGNLYSTEPLMSGYTWVISSGGVITAGAGTNTITVTWNTAGAQSVSVNYTNGDGCTATAATIKSVTVNPVFTFIENHSICNGETYNWQGTGYSVAGTYTAEYNTVFGCDSIYTLNLTLNPVYSFSENYSICDGETYTWQGVDYTSANTYTTNYSTINGCDSIYMLNLTVKSPTSSSITANACNSYIAPDGAVYTDSGIKTAVIPNSVGCDSTITINLTVNYSTTHSITETACYSYTAPDGAVYYSSGIETAVIPNTAGCDSTITIDLTINQSTTSSITETACDSYTAPDGTVYTTSGIETAVIPNTAGCDSTITIDLTINQSTTGSITETACDSYTAPDGTVYTTSGVETAVIPNTAGCDSTITIDLTINQSTTSSITETACDSYTAPDGTVYITSGIKTAVIPNYMGCDSTITIDLTINTVDVSVIVNDPTITANASGAIYQWVDCNNNYLPVSGETNQIFTAFINGNYAVIVTENSCTDTSLCNQITSIGFLENSFKTKIVLFPNPTKGLINIDMGAIYEPLELKITDINGKEIKNEIIKNSQLITFNIDEPAGIYLITIISDNGRAIIKLIKN